MLDLDDDVWRLGSRKRNLSWQGAGNDLPAIRHLNVNINGLIGFTVDG